MLCGYCHQFSTYCCPNKECRELYSRAFVCKECGMSQDMKCRYCGSKFVEEDEI